MTKNLKHRPDSFDLLRQQCDTRTFSENDLLRFIESLNVEGIEIISYFPQGVPVPFILKGRLQVKTMVLPTLVERISEFTIAQWQYVEMFPVGLSAPDCWHVYFEVAPRFGTVS